MSRTEGSNPSPSARGPADQETVADDHGGWRGRVGGDPGRQARFQPLLLTGAFLALLPTLVAGDEPTRSWLLVGGGALAVAGVLARWWGASPHRGNRARERVALLLTVVATPAFLALVWVRGAERPEAYLPLAAALLCAMAPVELRRLRVAVPSLVVAVFAVLLGRAGRSFTEAIPPLVFLASVGLLATALARELVGVRSAERVSRRDAQRRAELLAAVRVLPDAGLDEAVDAACATMRALGFDAAGCSMLRGEELAPLLLDGLHDPPDVLRVGEGIVGTCVAEDRTVVVGDYQADERRLTARPEVGSVVAVPIRVDGQVVGSLMGARGERRDPSGAEVEVAEVLAAHLGAAFATHRTVRRQREVRRRMEHLETMRSRFVTEVSDELRLPLTVVRDVAATLVSHGPHLEPTRRVRLLEDMAAQSDQLHRTIDALLDFSRFQSTHPEPSLEVLTVAELLEPVRHATDAELCVGAGTLEAEVRVDGTLVRHVLELLIAGSRSTGSSPQLRVSAEHGSIGVTVHAGPVPNGLPTLVRTLAAQLLGAAGAELRDGTEPTVRLPSAHAVEVAP